MVYRIQTRDKSILFGKRRTENMCVADKCDEDTMTYWCTIGRYLCLCLCLCLICSQGSGSRAYRCHL